MLENISIDVKGGSGENYKGVFEVKTSLTRSDRFRADQIRRQIIGPTPDGTAPLPALQTEAYMTGVVAVRVIKGPKWWEDSNNGLDLEDPEVVLALFDKMLELDEKKNQSLKEEAGKTLQKLKKKVEAES